VFANKTLFVSYILLNCSYQCPVLISSVTESVHNSNITQHDVDLSSVRCGLRESTEREWKLRWINLEVQRVQRVAPVNVSRDT